MKIYLAGKITGEPVHKCFLKFLDEARRLEFMLDDSDRIIIPLLIPGICFGIAHEEAMRICLAELKTCTNIFMLSDWKKSQGAIAEHEFALANGIEIAYI